VVLGSWAAVVVLAAAADPFAPGAPPAFWVLALAATVRWAVNYLLVVLVITWTRPPGGSPFADFREQIYSAGALCAGVSTAVLLAADPWFGLVALGVTLTVHRSTLITEYRFKATTDQRTGLTNDSWWTEQAEAAVAQARATGSRLGVLIADLDHFKEVNDEHGHLAGNEVLAAVARIISAEVRGDHDIVGRWGGEEFAVLLPNITPADLAVVAERIRARVAGTPTRAGAATITVTVSIGAAHHPEDGTTLHDLVTSADNAMYRAKANGRNRVAAATAG
jgi:diguanylate cyclase (GGDEF)-like protein